MSLFLIILAAGDSKRLKSSTPKAYNKVYGKTLLEHSLTSFANIKKIKKTIVVYNKKHKNYLNKINLKNALKITGGKTRQESVRLGLKCLPETKLVGIHDGARPCVTSETITNCINLAQIHGSAVPAIPVVDTIKESDTNKVILNTVDRTHLWQAQTPQVFEWAMIHEAYSNSTNEHTDDSSLLESLNIPIHLAEGDPRNIKVTTPVDLMLAEYILLNPEGA